jgi:hypothetical protein
MLRLARKNLDPFRRGKLRKNINKKRRPKAALA